MLHHRGPPAVLQGEHRAWSSQMPSAGPPNPCAPWRKGPQRSLSCVGGLAFRSWAWRCVLSKRQGIVSHYDNKNWSTSPVWSCKCLPRSKKVNQSVKSGDGCLTLYPRVSVCVCVCVFSITKLGSSSAQTLNKQNQVNNGMDLIYLKQYFSPFSN